MTGCTVKNEPSIEYVTKLQNVYIDIPDELFQCNILDVNASAVKTQSDVANLLVDLTEANAKCNNNVSSIKNIYNLQKKED